MSILKELGVQDYEPRVVNQLLEFTYRYVTCILDDAKVFANHAKKKVIDVDDVKLACDMILDKAFTSPPPRHVLSKLAETRNSMPLPPIKPHCGLRLPPDRYCLTATNYKLRSSSAVKKLTKSALESGKSSIKTQNKTALNCLSSGQPTTNSNTIGSSIKRAAPPISAPKTQITTIPKPVFKFSSQQKQIAVNPNSNKFPNPEGGSDEIKMEIDNEENLSAVINDSNNMEMSTENVTLKKEQDEDEFEIVQ
ncbi:transcription initiation factor TFIID subunit 9 isoform X2 [Condylostylus longicornis]|nr:transcription initiation factor TFIID subunit 9 isoform X2 [Condylostylus longicornis]